MVVLAVVVSFVWLCWVQVALVYVVGEVEG